MQKQDLRILFMGTPDFAKESLKTLVENGFNIVGVFCKADRPKGRGMKLVAPPVKEYATLQNIPVFQPEKIKNNPEVMDILNKLQPNLLVVVAYGKILPKEVLDYPKYGAINVHGSLLPKYRGAAPIQWSVINGDTLAGITTMYMDEGMDTGNMITKSEVEMLKDDTYGTLHDKLMVLGAKTLANDLEKLIANDGMLPSVPQSDDYTLAPMLTKEISKIDFNKEADTICNLVRGTNPFPTAWCKLDDERVYKVYKAVPYEYIGSLEEKTGQIVCLDDKKNQFIVKCKDGYINILELKAPGSRQMTAAEYIRGDKVKVGEIFV